MNIMDIAVVIIVLLGLLYWIGKGARWALNMMFTLLLGGAVVALVVASPFLALAGGSSLVKRLFEKVLLWRQRAMINGPL